ncbi:ATP-binding protein [Streptomyces sp. NPDC003077]|uniref:ATP-binding protein n=1 Tax=Streptomyces sp. NPDC003077 TaxID=3154443 RepID=UPI0033B4F4CD
MGNDDASNGRTPGSPPAQMQPPYVFSIESTRHALLPRVFRDFVGGILRSLRQEDRLVEAAKVCASELSTNAYVHSRGGAVMLRVLVERSTVRIGVHDTSAERPYPAPDLGEPTTWGRGLLIVAALADKWGTDEGDPLGPYAKSVWFEMATA